MSGVSWERARPLLHAALDLPGAERRSFLGKACADDPALLAYVVGVLDHAADDGMDDVANPVALFDVLPPTPTTIGPYRILSYIGEGGMGVVYLGTREPFADGRFAIKVLPGAALSPALRERFAAEEQILMKLTHPGIAQLDGLGVLPDGTPYFAMEYVKGESLTAYCDARACPMAERLRLVRAVCEPVQYAHGQLVIHRDLKPPNILVPDPNDPGARAPVKLLDFGIATPIEAAGAGTPVARSALRMMTRPYAAPEQVRGEPTDVRTDVFALGVILYELLAGGRPFDRPGMTAAQLEARITAEDPERPSAMALRAPAASPAAARAASLGAGAWDDLDALCLKALRKNPEQRYATVQSFAQDIDRYLRGEPLEARAPTVRYRAGKFARRNWRPLAAAGAGLLFVAGIVSFYTVRITGARNGAVAEAARTRRLVDLMRDLLSGGDDDTGPADTLRVVTIIRRAEGQLPDLRADTAVQAELYDLLGRVEQARSDYPAADSLLDAALVRRRAFYGADSREVAASLVALGELRDGQARYADAKRLLRDALAMARRHLPPNDPAVADAALGLGTALEHDNAYDEATRVLAEAVRIRAAGGRETRELATALTELANAQFSAERYDVADSLNRRVLAMDERLVGLHHPWIADDLINLGAVAYEREHYAETERLYRRALTITRGFYPEVHYKTASNLYMLSKPLVELKRYGEADTLLREALAIDRQVFPPVHPRVANVLNGLGKLAGARDSNSAAISYFAQAATIYRAINPGGSVALGVALTNVATSEATLCHFARADSIFREALAVYGRVLPPHAPNIGITHAKRRFHNRRSCLRQISAHARWRNARCTATRRSCRTARRR